MISTKLWCRLENEFLDLLVFHSAHGYFIIIIIVFLVSFFLHPFVPLLFVCVLFVPFSSFVATQASGPCTWYLIVPQSSREEKTDTAHTRETGHQQATTGGACRRHGCSGWMRRVACVCVGSYPCVVGCSDRCWPLSHSSDNHNVPLTPTTNATQQIRVYPLSLVVSSYSVDPPLLSLPSPACCCCVARHSNPIESTPPPLPIRVHQSPDKMISAILFINLKGDIIISRYYRDNVRSVTTTTTTTTAAS